MKDTVLICIPKSRARPIRPAWKISYWTADETAFQSLNECDFVNDSPEHSFEEFVLVKLFLWEGL